MPTRRALLRTCAGLSLGGATTTRAVARPTATGRTTAAFDPGETVDALRALGEPAVGRVDLAALHALGLDADRTLDEAFLRRLPGLADPTAPSDARSVLRTIRGPATVRAVGRAGGHALYDVEPAHGRAALGHREDRIVAAVPQSGSTARGALVDLLSAGAGGPPRLAPVVDAFDDADAFVGVPVGADPPVALRGVTALGLGVDLDADHEFRARFLGDIDAARARAALATLGVALTVLSGLEVIRDAEGLTIRAAVDRESQGGDSFILFLLVVVLAVLGTFVLGLGSRVESTAPAVSLSFEYDRQTGLVTITHAGGDRIGTDARVLVRYTHDGESVVERWRESDGIVAGDQYTTERAVDPETVVRVVWQGESTATLGQFTTPA